jgi:hypothetical protein
MAGDDIPLQLEVMPVHGPLAVEGVPLLGARFLSGEVASVVEYRGQIDLCFHERVPESLELILASGGTLLGKVQAPAEPGRRFACLAEDRSSWVVSGWTVPRAHREH